MPTALRNNGKGFTYVEVLVALSVLFIGMMGMLSVMGTSMTQNLENRAKSEAMQVAKLKMDELRTSNFATLSSNSTGEIKKRLLGKVYRDFNVSWTVTSYSPNSRIVTMVVRWTYKGKVVDLYNASTIITQET